MRGLIIVAAVVLLLALVGWISFSNDEGQSGIILEKETIKEDTREILDTGDDLIDRARTSTSEESAIESEEEIENRSTAPAAID